MKTLSQLREALEIGTDKIVDQYKKATPGENVIDPADKGEYDNEGEMAKTQLRGILADAGHMVEMFEDEQNLPEWVQNKITKAADYLNSAHRYMMNKDETNEEVDERKLTPKEIKKALASGKAKAKPKSQVSLKKAPFKIPESLEEKLQVSDGMAKWIEDFQASDAPQFKGKDKNERREMAIAAYLAAKRRDKKED